MKPLNILKIAVLALPLLLGSCRSAKTIESTAGTPGTTPADKQVFMQKVTGNAQNATFLTSKIKFRVQVGSQDIALTGNLRMKRDDVIRLQLMAFGFVEAGRLEFTKDYVLVMDRINKQYLKVPYDQLDFLRSSGLNFYSLQAMFWNELFMPGMSKVTETAMSRYGVAPDGNSMVISYEQASLAYKWLAGPADGTIRTASVTHESKSRKTQLDWNYKDFKPLGTKPFPTDNAITFTTGDKEVKIDMKLGSIGNDSDWETRTEVSGKYKQVMLDDIMRRLMSL